MTTLKDYTVVPAFVWAPQNTKTWFLGIKKNIIESQKLGDATEWHASERELDVMHGNTCINSISPKGKPAFLSLKCRETGFAVFKGGKFIAFSEFNIENKCFSFAASEDAKNDLIEAIDNTKKEDFRLEALQRQMFGAEKQIRLLLNVGTLPDNFWEGLRQLNENDMLPYTMLDLQPQIEAKFA